MVRSLTLHMTSLSYSTIAQILPEVMQNIYIAYSGGVDSHVLLHLCATQTELKSKITAVYVHHGLQSVADVWGEHCRQCCVELGVNFQMLKVDARAKRGESPEAAARQSRYNALRNLLQTDDILLVAQHREDQLETVLLQLFRGSGIQGLAAMPAGMPFGPGLILRPFLDVSKQDILDYAARNALQWVEDPTNFSHDFDRNFLRNQVLPMLKKRWPALDKTVARSAKHCADASVLLEASLAPQLALVIDETDRSLRLALWCQSDPKIRNWLLRHWLQTFGLNPPSQALLQVIIDQVIFAKTNANPQVAVQDYYVRKYRQKLYCIQRQYWQIETEPRFWPEMADTLQLNNGTSLERTTVLYGIDQALWHTHAVKVVYRHGGEKFKLPGRSGHHCLKKLYQEADIPPWERNVRPLIYIDDRLAAVAGLWVDEWVWSKNPAGCYAINWRV